MPKYLVNANYTPEGLKGAIEQGFEARIAEVTALVESAGGTVEALYFAYGSHDVVGIIDGPEASAVALSLAINAGGAVSLATTPLITAGEMDAARAQLPNYRAPGT